MPRHKPRVPRAQQLAVQRQVKRRVSGSYKARQKRKGRHIEIQGIVRSQRGRIDPSTGSIDPLRKPALGMPMSKQDYFLLSTAIANMSWDRKKWILEIEFTTGHVYQFIGVNEGKWIMLRDAPSKGLAFHKLIYGYWTGPKGNKTYHPKYKEVRIK